MDDVVHISEALDIIWDTATQGLPRGASMRVERMRVEHTCQHPGCRKAAVVLIFMVSGHSECLCPTHSAEFGGKILDTVGTWATEALKKVAEDP